MASAARPVRRGPPAVNRRARNLRARGRGIAGSQPAAPASPWTSNSPADLAPGLEVRSPPVPTRGLPARVSGIIIRTIRITVKNSITRNRHAYALARPGVIEARQPRFPDRKAAGRGAHRPRDCCRPRVRREYTRSRGRGGDFRDPGDLDRRGNAAARAGRGRCGGHRNRIRARAHPHGHEDRHAAARCSAVGHRRVPGRDRGPVDAEHGGRRALRAGCGHGAGRGQPRHAHPAGQCLHRGFLRRRRARRRRVLPRPVQRRARGGAQGTERDDLRPRGCGRTHQPCDAPGRVGRCARGVAAGGLVEQPPHHHGFRRRGEREGRRARHGHVRGLGELPRRVRARALRREPDARVTARRRQPAAVGLRVLHLRSHRRPRRAVVRWSTGRDRRIHVLRRSHAQPDRRDSESRHGRVRPRVRQRREPAQPHAVRGL